jgi:hypothetical protein
MSALEKIRQHTYRAAIPGAMTLARPFFGEKARRHLRNGEFAAAEKYFGIAAALDKGDGFTSRLFHAVTEIGGKGDAIADAALKAQTVHGLAPYMSPITTMVIVGLELDCARMNRAIQPKDGHPIVPKGAKIGSLVQAVGGGAVVDGLRRENKIERVLGEATAVSGTLLRRETYHNLYRRLPK